MKYRKQVDYYQALGITFGASQGEIVDAYRQGLERLKQSLLEGATPQPEILDEMRHAYKVLKTPAARRLYDASYVTWHPNVGSDQSEGWGEKGGEASPNLNGDSNCTSVTENSPGSDEEHSDVIWENEAVNWRCKKCRWRPEQQTAAVDTCGTET